MVAAIHFDHNLFRWHFIAQTVAAIVVGPEAAIRQEEEVDTVAQSFSPDRLSALIAVVSIGIIRRNRTIRVKAQDGGTPRIALGIIVAA